MRVGVITRLDLRSFDGSTGDSGHDLSPADEKDGDHRQAPGWTDEWLALGLRAEDGRGPAYVSVWRRGGAAEVRIPVRHLAGSDLPVHTEVLHPSAARADSAASWDPATGELRVSVPRTPGILLIRLSQEERTRA